MPCQRHRLPSFTNVRTLMKLRTFGLCKAFFLLAASLFMVTAQAAIIENDVVIIDSPNPAYGDQWLTLQSMENTSGEGLFAFSITATTPRSYGFGSVGIAEAYGLYKGNVGDVLDAAFVAGHTPITSNFAIGSGEVQTFQLGETKLFAFWDAGFGPRPETYGWFKLTLTGAGLVVSADA